MGLGIKELGILGLGIMTIRNNGIRHNGNTRYKSLYDANGYRQGDYIYNLTVVTNIRYEGQ